MVFPKDLYWVHYSSWYIYIYIYNLSNVCNNMMPFLFANGTNIFHSGSDAHRMQQEIDTDVIQISQWLKVNKLSLNVKKTHFMAFMNKNSSKPDIVLRIDGYKMNKRLNPKFLGVIIDCQLTWKYINYISGNFAKGIGIIIKARKLLDQETPITLYYSFIHPYLYYCN